MNNYQKTEMKKTIYDKASRRYTIIKVLGIIALAFLMLGSTIGAIRSPIGTWTKQGNTLLRSENYREAVAAYDKALEINRHDSQAWDGKGVALEFLDEFDGAIKAFDKAIKINPQDSIAWVNNCLLYTSRCV